MPKGKAPFPKKSNVDAGKADKAKPVRGGYERAKTTNTGVNRTITYGKKGGTVTRSKFPGPSK